MEIRYSENVKLVINITDRMRRDFKECRVIASDPGADHGKFCNSCSLNVNVEDIGICELPAVLEEFEGYQKPARRNF